MQESEFFNPEHQAVQTLNVIILTEFVRSNPAEMEGRKASAGTFPGFSPDSDSPSLL